MRKANLIAGAAIVLLTLILALTVDPLGFMAPDDTEVDAPELPGDKLAEGGLEGSGRRPLPDADPRTWEGDPVGRLVLGLGSATLQGSVTGEGNPLRFARVRVILPPPYGDHAVRTRKDGTWAIAGLPAGSHEVCASASGYVGRTVAAPPVSDGQTSTVDPIDLRRRTDLRSTILVKVTDTFGGPISGAKVLATTMPWNLHMAMGPDVAGIRSVHSKTGVTDETGKVRLGPLPPEDYAVVAVAPGYINAGLDKLVVSAGCTRSVALRLREGVSVQGRVTDPAGGGVGGATVMGMAQPSFAWSPLARTEADGSFVLEGLRRGDYMFVGWEEKLGTAMSPGKAPGRIEIKLPGTGRVKGTVVWEDGTPVTAGTVRPFQIGPFQYVYSLVHQLGEDGTFEFDVTAGDWNCRVQSDEGFVSDGNVAKVAVGETSTITIKVPKTGVVRGVIMDEDGNHVEGAEIFVMQGGFPASPSREHYARSDAEGAFEVPGLGPDPVDLHVEHTEYANTKIRVSALPANKAVEQSVRLTKGAGVGGRVADAEGRGIPGEQVNLALSGEWFGARNTFTDGDGTYRFDAVTPGTYLVTTGPFEQGARGLSRSDVTVGASGLVTIDFQHTAAAGSVSGLVTQAGKAVAGATVTLTDARGPEKTVGAKTDENGRFLATGLQYGRVRIEATTPAGMSRARTVSVAEGEAPTDVTIDIGTATVRARVLDPQGEPASGCWMSVELADSQETGWSVVKAQGNSDSNGVFQSKGLQPARYVVRVNRVEFAQFRSAPFDLAEGEAKDLGDLRMAPGVLLQGVVRDDAGAPIEKATVSLKDMQGRPVQLFSMATTGSDGRYAMHSIEPGRYTVHFQARGHAPGEQSIEITDAGASANGTLPRGGAVWVTVRNPDGEPLQGVRVRLYDDQGRLVSKTISLANFDSGRRYTDTDGGAGLEDLAGGTYVVTCSKAGYAVIGADPRTGVEPGGRSEVQVVMEPLP